MTCLLQSSRVDYQRLPQFPPQLPRHPPPPLNEPDDQQQYQRADSGVDDRCNNAGAEMDSQLRKQPTADEGTYYSDDEIADDPEPGALHDLAGQPSGNEADDQYDEETLT